MITYKVDLNRRREAKVTGDITKDAKKTEGYVTLHNALSSLVFALDEIFHEGLIDSCIEDGITLEVTGYNRRTLRTELRFKEVAQKI